MKDRRMEERENVKRIRGGKRKREVDREVEFFLCIKSFDFSFFLGCKGEGIKFRFFYSRVVYIYES